MNVILSAAFLSRRQALFSAVDVEIVFKYKTEILILRKAWNILPWLLIKMSHRIVFYSSLNTVLRFSWMKGGLYLKKIIYLSVCNYLWIKRSEKPESSFPFNDHLKIDELVKFTDKILIFAEQVKLNSPYQNRDGTHR